ncbi:hypothetical protein ADUPG1_006459 [Aduncisulcus paluster]|uniref:Uncharacterized protein n=1 Tax=Aduncisulcus paluster TaxID=2918883 RepID=A0ABQ5KK32_9EUKA|nr:hypothetical protein ADUPG1_006459 [Aduncisulcus paluster]
MGKISFRQTSWIESKPNQEIILKYGRKSLSLAELKEAIAEKLGLGDGFYDLILYKTDLKHPVLTGVVEEGSKILAKLIPAPNQTIFFTKNTSEPIFDIDATVDHDERMREKYRDERGGGGRDDHVRKRLEDHSAGTMGHKAGMMQRMGGTAAAPGLPQMFSGMKEKGELHGTDVKEYLSERRVEDKTEVEYEKEYNEMRDILIEEAIRYYESVSHEIPFTKSDIRDYQDDVGYYQSSNAIMLDLRALSAFKK